MGSSDAPWLNGSKPIDIAPLIYKISTRKNWNVKQALHEDGWISKINLNAALTMDHIHQYISLWIQLRQVNLQDDVADDIVWRLTTNGEYTSKIAYEIQFLGSIVSNMNKMV